MGDRSRDFEPRWRSLSLENGAQRVPNGLKVEWDGVEVSEHRSRPAPSRLFAEFAVSRKGIVLELWLFADSARLQGTGDHDLPGRPDAASEVW